MCVEVPATLRPAQVRNRDGTSLLTLLAALLALLPALFPPLPEPLPHLLALLRRHPLPAAHVVEQLPPLRRIGVHDPPELLAQVSALLRRQAAKFLPPLQDLLPLLGRHLLEPAVVLQHGPTIRRRHRIEPLEIAPELGALRRRQRLQLAEPPPELLLLLRGQAAEPVLGALLRARRRGAEEDRDDQQRPLHGRASRVCRTA